MSGVITILKKELRTYFYSPLAYVLVGLFLFIMGNIFAKFIIIYEGYNEAVMYRQAPPITLDKLANYLYSNMAFFLIIFTPFLTMRLFAEEKRQKTLELLLTAPLGSFQLVLGKFLAAFILMGVMVGVTGLYVLFLALWGNPELSIIGSTYLGLFLTLGCYLAVGALMSALTESQALAAVFTGLVLIFLFLLQSLAEGVNFTTGFIEWGAVLRYISPLGHYTSFSEGLIQVKDVVYYLSFMAFGLFLTHRVVESHRWR